MRKVINYEVKVYNEDKIIGTFERSFPANWSQVDCEKLVRSQVKRGWPDATRWEVQWESELS